MKLSNRLRNHKWKSSSLAPGDHGWTYNEDPIKAADLLDQCEVLISDFLRLTDKNEGKGELPWTETTLIRFRAALADLRGRPTSGVVTAYYVLEDGKLRALPLEVDAAIDLIREEFVAGHINGTLCLRDVGGKDFGFFVHATGDWAMFEIEARAWLIKAIDIALRKGG